MAEEILTPPGVPAEQTSPVSSTPVAADAAARIPAPAGEIPSNDPVAALLGTGADAAGSEAMDVVSIEELLKQASFEDPSSMAGGGAGGVAAPDAADFQLPNFQQVIQDAQVSSIDLLRDVELNVKIELGRARMLVEDVLKLSESATKSLLFRAYQSLREKLKGFV